MMSKKYYESMREQDIRDARQVIRDARNYRNSRAYHADLMRVARLHIEFVRYVNNRLHTFYQG